MSCVTPLGGDPWNLVLGFLQALLNVPFAFIGLFWYPFTAISHGHEYNYMLRPREIADLGMVLGSLT